MEGRKGGFWVGLLGFVGKGGAVLGFKPHVSMAAGSIENLGGHTTIQSLIR